MNASSTDVVKALAYRFQSAVTEEWDDDRCEVEASAFFAELRHRGWERNPDADFRIVPRRRANDDHIAAEAAAARAAIRAARPTDTEGA